MSAHEPLQGSDARELMGGTEENSVSLTRGQRKKKQKKIELVARPESCHISRVALVILDPLTSCNVVVHDSCVSRT